MEHAPPPVRSLVADIPEPLDHLISRCLEPDPDKRYQTTAELQAALNRLDEKGEPIPIKRVVRLPAVVAVVAVLLAISVAVWWYQFSQIPPAPHEPVTVVIADFQNGTNDPAFDRHAGADAPSRARGRRASSPCTTARHQAYLGVRPPGPSTKTRHASIAVKQGLGVVLAGSIAAQGGGYDMSTQGDAGRDRRRDDRSRTGRRQGTGHRGDHDAS